MSTTKKFKRHITFFFQRLFRGFDDSDSFDDSDTWSLDVHLAKLILPRLIRFRELTIGTPGPFEGTHEEWLKVLDEMIAAFTLIASPEYYNIDNKTDGDIIDGGLKLFAKYYNCLWW